jgi:hypothetical protein
LQRFERLEIENTVTYAAAPTECIHTQDSVIAAREDDSTVNGSFVTVASPAAPFHPSDIEPTTPLSTKLRRRMQLLETVEEQDEPPKESGRQMQLSGSSAGDGTEIQLLRAAIVPEVAPYDNEHLRNGREKVEEIAIGSEFRSVLQQLEDAGLERQEQERQQHLAPDLFSCLALPAVPLITPRDRAPSAPICTPMVFSTVHLKSPTQVAGQFALQEWHVTREQVKQDGVFYDDDVLDWQQENDNDRHAFDTSIADHAEQHTVQRSSLATAVIKSQGVYCENGMGAGAGDGSEAAIMPPSSSSSLLPGFSPADELFEALKTRIEVKRGLECTRRVTLKFTGTLLQAEIAEELRIYEQLHGASLAADELSPASTKETPAQDKAGREGGGAFAGEEGLTPSQLLGFEIAEV